MGFRTYKILDNLDLVFLYLFWSLSRVWSGREDGGVSVTEIRLSKSRKNAIAKVLDTENRREWHRNGLVKFTLVLIAISLSQYWGGLVNAAILFLSLSASQVVIFNPIVAKWVAREQEVKYNFYHLSNSGWDGFWKKLIGEVPYYYTALVIYIGGFLINYLNII